MKKNLIRIISLAMILAVFFTLLTACDSSNEKAGTEAPTASGSIAAPASTEQPLSEYTVKALFPGDTPTDFDLVLAEAEKQVKDSLNVKLDFQFIPWSDYGNKVQVKMAAGDDFDLHLNAPWLHINQMISNKMIQPWDDLLAKYGQDVIKVFPQIMIDSNKFDGKIWGIPLGNVLAGVYPGFMIRGDLREKYGMPPLQSFDDLEKYFLKVKENEKGVVPLTWNASQFSYISSKNPYGTFAFGQNNASVIIPFNADGTLGEIKPIYESQDFIDSVKMLHKWYQEGIIDKDVMAQKDGKGACLSGKAAISNIDFIDEVKLQAAVPGAKLEMAKIYGDIKPVTDFKMWNFLCLNAKCKDPERVTKWYDWIFADQSHYDLFQYGITDKHWTDTGKGTYDIPADVDAAKNYNFPGYVLLWNPNFDRVNAKSSKGYMDLNAFEKNPENYTRSIMTGFTPNYDSIKNEIAKVSAVWPETIYVLTAGVVDPDKGLAEAKKKLEAAGYLTIVEEAKKQINDFITANKK